MSSTTDRLCQSLASLPRAQTHFHSPLDPARERKRERDTVHRVRFIYQRAPATLLTHYSIVLRSGRTVPYVVYITKLHSEVFLRDTHTYSAFLYTVLSTHSAFYSDIILGNIVRQLLFFFFCFHTEIKVDKCQAAVSVLLCDRCTCDFT